MLLVPVHSRASETSARIHFVAVLRFNPQAGLETVLGNQLDQWVARGYDGAFLNRELRDQARHVGMENLRTFAAASAHALQFRLSLFQGLLCLKQLIVGSQLVVAALLHVFERFFA